MSLPTLSLETIASFSHRIAGSLGSDVQLLGVRGADRAALVQAATEAARACPPAQLERPEGLGRAWRASVAKAARP